MENFKERNWWESIRKYLQMREYKLQILANSLLAKSLNSPPHTLAFG